MGNVRHKNYVGHNNHAITANPDDVATGYVDIAARDADTDFQIQANVNKAVRVETSPPGIYVLLSVTPTVDWSPDLFGSTFNTFLSLLDVIPATYVGQDGKHIYVDEGGGGPNFGQPLRVTDDVTFNDLIVSGDLTVQGTTTTLDTETLLVEDKNIELGVVATPTDVTADSGGITLKGATDKLITWINSTKAWTLNQITAITETLSIGSSAAPGTDVSLDLLATDKGFRKNRLTTAQRLALTSPEGMSVYDTDLKQDMFHNGTVWINKGSGGGDVVGTPGTLNNQLMRAIGTSGMVIQGGAPVFMTTGGSMGFATNSPDGVIQIDNALKSKQTITLGQLAGGGFQFTGFGYEFNRFTAQLQNSADDFIVNVGITNSTEKPIMSINGSGDFVFSDDLSVSRAPDSDAIFQIEHTGGNKGLKVKGVGGGRLHLYDTSADPDKHQYTLVSTGGTLRIFRSDDDLGGESIMATLGNKFNFGPDLIGIETVDSDADMQLTNQAGVAKFKVKSSVGAAIALKDTGALADVKQVELVSQDGILHFNQVDDDLIGSSTIASLDLSTGFLNLVVGRFTENDIRMSRKGTTVTEVYTAADDLPAPTTGIILPSGKYEFKTAVTLLLAERLVVSAPGATVTIASEDVGTPIIAAFSGVTLTAVNSAQISIIDSTILTQEGNELFDISSSGSSFIENVRYISTTAPFGDATIGRVTGTPLVMKTCAFIGVSNGLRAMDAPGLLIDQVRIVSDTSDIAALIRIEGNLTDTANISGVVAATGPSGSVFYFDPIITEPINVSGCVNVGAGTYFETGDTGIITGITDPGGSGVVASTADVGGVAEFTDVAHGRFVGEMLRMALTGTAYDGDYFVLSVPTADTFQLVSVAGIPLAYAGAASGVWNVRNRRIASVAHGRTDGETFSLFGTIEFGGGYTIFNAAADPNAFDISLLPLDQTTSTVSETGTWDTGSLTEKSPFVTLSGDNGAQKASATTAEAFLTGNTDLTIPPPGATGALMILNASTWTGEQEELLLVKNNGAVRFDGIKITPLLVDVSVGLEPNTAGKTLQARIGVAHMPSRVVTFTNATNLINETDTPRVNGELVTFFNNPGTLPAELSEGIFYYVISVTANSFQVSYLPGGTAVSFTDNGSGTNEYCFAGLHGSKPQLTISAGTPQDLNPKALIQMNPKDERVILISNLTDSVTMKCGEGYDRLVGT